MSPMGLRTSSTEYLGLKFVRLETSVISSNPGSSKGKQIFNKCVNVMKSVFVLMTVFKFVT